MTRVYHDWEFLDAGEAGTYPISVGIHCPEKEMEYYAIFDNHTTLDMALRNEWLRNNVFNSLPFTFERDFDFPDGTESWSWDYNRDHPDYENIKLRRTIRSEVQSFLAEIENIELWGWYSAHDHYLLGTLFDRMMNLPGGVPMWTNDLRQEAHRLRVPMDLIPQQESGLHNALADAKHMPVIHSYLEQVGHQMLQKLYNHAVILGMREGRDGLGA